jgi:hypothetical protein
MAPFILLSPSTLLHLAYRRTQPLARRSSHHAQSPRWKNEVVVPKHGAALGKAQNMLKWQAKNRKEEEGAVVGISIDVEKFSAGGRLARGGVGDIEARMNRKVGA